MILSTIFTHMAELHTKITINAPAEEVWAVLTDFERYAEWNPFIVNSTGKAEVGATLTNTMRQPDKDHVFKPTVTKCDPPRYFEWLGKLFFSGLFDGRHYFQLEETEPGKTVFTHGEYFSGILVGLIWKKIEAGTRAGFEAMNEALKAKLESQA